MFTLWRFLLQISLLCSDKIEIYYLQLRRSSGVIEQVKLSEPSSQAPKLSRASPAAPKSRVGTSQNASAAIRLEQKNQNDYLNGVPMDAKVQYS